MVIKAETGLNSIPEKRSRGQEVVERLRQAILHGQLQPGMRLREEELADLLKVSRGPIREALGQLELEGLVIREANKSTTVARLSREDVEEVYSLRLALERLAIKLAIRNGEPQHFTKMQEVVNQMETFLEKGITEPQAAELDVNFHEIIYEAANHNRLHTFWWMLRPQIYIFFLSRNVANKDFRGYLVPGHQVILDALLSKDEHRAVQVIEEHLHGAYDRVLKSYEKLIQERDKE